MSFASGALSRGVVEKLLVFLFFVFCFFFVLVCMGFVPPCSIYFMKEHV